MSEFMDIMHVYAGSDGGATKALYARLETLGPAGVVALNVFRACKASERAKEYSGRYKGRAYDKKQWSIDNLCTALLAEAQGLGLVWGWAEDPHQSKHKHVFYLETPHGQVSFHSEYRGQGPAFPNQWDGVKGVASDRICRWIAALFEQAKAA
jgi:hypothetical protein